VLGSSRYALITIKGFSEGKRRERESDVVDWEKREMATFWDAYIP
jgi:hypothetical protein